MSTMPVPPKHLLWQVSQNSVESQFIDSAREMTASLLSNIESSGIEIPEQASVLDFGCGVGKVLIGLHEARPRATSASSAILSGNGR
jgi:hypothetical protein